MKLFQKLQNLLEKLINPLAIKLNNSLYIKALTEGFLASIPITIGTAVIAVLANLPIDSWTAFLNQSGLYQVAQDFIAMTMSLLAIYISFTISLSLSKKKTKNALISSVLTVASFLALMPLSSVDIKGMATSVLEASYLGSGGIFVAIILGLTIPTFIGFLESKKLTLKLPDSVPPMVADSLSPTFVAMILFVVIFIIKYVLSLTIYENLFQLIFIFVSKPILSLGTSVWALIFAFTFMNLCWFFGIHPSPLFNCYLPVIIGASVANLEAMSQGRAMPYFVWQVVFYVVYLGGNGNTLGLCVSTLFAKSEKYKVMRKLVVPANIFNINEPIIFGFPTMLNPLYFVPMVFSSLFTGSIIYGVMQFVGFHINPAVQLPWVTPGFIQAIIVGGIPLLLIWILALGLHTVIYLPFFLMDDRNALKEERKTIL